MYRAPITVESWSANVITNVTLRDMTVEFTGGGTSADAQIAIKSPGVDARKLPVWGVYARNVEALTLQNVQFKSDKADARPVGRFEQVKQLTLDHFEFPANPAVEKPLQMEGVGKVSKSP